MTRQEWTPNSTQMAAMEAFASCLGFLMGLAGGLVTLTILCLILGKISEILLKQGVDVGFHVGRIGTSKANKQKEDTMKAMFDSVQDLVKFYNARAGVEWTSDPYEWIGSICVDFKLDILTAEEVEENIRKAGGVMVFDYDDQGNQI